MVFEVSFVQHTCNSGVVSVTLTAQHGVDFIQVDKDAESVLEACELALRNPSLQRSSGTSAVHNGLRERRVAWKQARRGWGCDRSLRHRGAFR